MLTLRAGLYEYLKTRTDVTDLVGTGDDARIYPTWLPQDAMFPAIRMMLISSEHVTFNRGASQLASAMLQIDAYADDEDDATKLATAIRESLHSAMSMDQPKVSWCKCERQTDAPWPPPDASGSPRFTIQMDFTFWYQESVPVFA